MEAETYYEILGIRPDASHREIVHAFARLAEHYRNAVGSEPTARERLHQVREAYETLTDYRARVRYNIEHGFPDPPRHENEGEPSGILNQIGVLVPGSWPVLLPALTLLIGGNLAYLLLVGELPWFWLRYVNGPEDYVIYPVASVLFILLARLLARSS